MQEIEVAGTRMGGGHDNEFMVKTQYKIVHRILGGREQGDRQNVALQIDCSAAMARLYYSCSTGPGRVQWATPLSTSQTR